MKPLFSQEQRIQTNRELIIALYNQTAKISGYGKLVPYLDRIELLQTLKKSGTRGYYDSLSSYREAPCFNEDNAKTYFEWLIATVSDAVKVSDDIREQANDQLFQFIHVLGDSIQKAHIQLIASYDWQNLDRRLTEMQNIIDKGDKSIIEVLKPLLELMKKNTKLLDILMKENERLFGKGNPT